MAISYVNSASDANNSISLPSGWVPGDVAIVVAVGGTATPVGWKTGTTTGHRLGYRVLQTGDTTTGTWTNASFVGVVIYSGNDINNPLDAVTSVNGYGYDSGISSTVTFTSTALPLPYSTSKTVQITATTTSGGNAKSLSTSTWTNRTSGLSLDQFGVQDSGTTTNSYTLAASRTWSSFTFGIREPVVYGFPIVIDPDTTSGVQTSNSSSWTLTYPTNIAAGDLLLVSIAIDGTGSSINNTNWEWSETYSYETNTEAFAGVRIASGSETGSFTFDTGGFSEQGAWVVYRIPAGTWYGSLADQGGTTGSLETRGFHAVPAGAGDTNSANPDPPSLDPTQWGTENTLWIAIAAADTSRTFSAYPSSPDTFTNTGYLASGGSTGATLAWARLEKNASSVDPGTFTISASDDWATITIAVRPRQYFSRNSQAQAEITGGATQVQKVSQAQTHIKTTYRGYAQSVALIFTSPQYSEVFDAFGRSVSPGWGTSDNAGAWEISDSTGWSVTSNEGRVDLINISASYMHLSKMVSPTRWKISFEYGLLNATQDGTIYIRAHDGSPASLTNTSALFGKLAGVHIASNGNISFAVGFAGNSTTNSSGGTYTSLGDTWVYEAYVWWESGSVKSSARTWNKAVPGTVYSASHSHAATADSLPGHITFQALTLGTTSTIAKIDNFKVTKWMAEPAAQAQTHIKQTYNIFAQAQTTITALSEIPASIYYAEGLNFSVLGTTWTDAAEIAATNLVANKTYLILVGGFIENDSASSQAEVRVGYGTTPTIFTDGTGSIDPSLLTTSKHPFGFMFTHTQGGSAERYVVQVRNSNASFTVAGDVWIAAIRLSDELVENTDYYTNSVTVDYSTTASYVSQASVTFTPNGSDPWLVLGHATRLSPTTDGTSTVKLRINDSVANALVETNEDGGDITNDIRPLVMAAVYVPSNASHTVTVDAAHSGSTAGTIFNSSIFALNLSKFTDVAYERTAGDIVPATDPSWTTVATVSPTPTTTGDWLVLGYLTTAFVTVTSTRLLKTRLQINPSGGGLASDPAYGDDAPGMSNWDTADLQPVLYLNKVSLTSGAARTINLDASVVQPPGTYAVRERSLVAVPLLYTGTGSATRNKSAQTQSQIKQVYQVWAQTQTNVKQVYQVWSQSNAHIKIIDIESYAQTQTLIKQTYSSFAQSQAQIKQTYQIWAQSNSNIQQTYNSWAQAQSHILTIVQVFAQANASIIVVNMVMSQTQGQIKSIYQVYSQAQSYIKSRTSVWAQAAVWIKQTYPFGGGETIIANDTFTEVSGVPLTSHTPEIGTQWIETWTYATEGNFLDWANISFDRAELSGTDLSTEEEAGTAVAINGEMIDGYVQGQIYAAHGHVMLKQVSDNLSFYAAGDVSSPGLYRLTAEGFYYLASPAGTGVFYRLWASGSNPTILKVERRSSLGELGTGWTLETSDNTAQNQTASGKVGIYGWGYEGDASTVHAAIDTFTAVSGSAVVGPTFSQAQAKIKQIYNQSSQAQTQIKTSYQSFAQAQTQILTTYQSYAQTNSQIKTTYNTFAQTEAQIISTYQVYAQAQTYIKAIDISAWAQTQAQIYAPATIVYVYAQSQALVQSTVSAWAQTNTQILQTYAVHAQAQSHIQITVQSFAQANAGIVATSFVYAQAGAQIKTSYQVYAQSGTYIKSRNNSFAQAAVWIKQTYPFGGGTTLVYDTFTESVNTNLTSHTPEIGGPWVKRAGATLTPQVIAATDLVEWTNITSTETAIYTAETLSDGYIQAQLDAVVIDGPPYLVIREKTSAVLNYYSASPQAIYRVANGGYIQIASTGQGSFAWARFQATGTGPTSLKLEGRNTENALGTGWSVETTDNAVNNQVTSGYIGIAGWYNNDEEPFVLSNGFDNFKAISGSSVEGPTFAQSQARIKQTYNQSSQAQAQIIRIANAYAQAGSTILSIYFSVAQANAYISAQVSTYAQAGASIRSSNNGYAQALTEIYIPVYARPVEDIATNDWVRVVI